MKLIALMKEILFLVNMQSLIVRVVLLSVMTASRLVGPEVLLTVDGTSTLWNKLPFKMMLAVL